MASAAVLLQVAAPARVEASQSDLSYISQSTWTADPAAGRVHVVAVVTATSHTVDSGGRRYYYDQVQLTLPSFSAGFTATSPDGQKLPIALESVTSSSVIVVVGLGERLYSDQSGSFTLKFDLVDTGGSTDRDFRISDNVVSFPVWAFSSPNAGGSSIAVTFPPNFTVQEEFGGLTRSVSSSGQVVFTSGANDDPTETSAWFTAVQPVADSDFRVRSVVLGSLSLSLRYWVDDVGWADQVERVLRAGYPVLRAMIGLGDPAQKTLTVEEASSEEIGGFSGAYDPDTGQVLVSYFADPFVILHEVAHMWFNSNLVSDRWVQEGFASYYAQQAVDRLGYIDHAPVLTDRMRQNAVPLNDWVAADQPNTAAEAYLYGASLEAARQIAAEAGQDGLALVWGDARSGREAYQPAYGTQSDVAGAGAIDWRRLYDLLETTTGKSYSAIWRSWVMDPSQAALLDQRDAALAAYAGAEQVASPWNLPPEIRRSLDGWQYSQAIALVTQARGILAQRDQIATEAATEQTKPPPALQTAFEQSGLVVASLEATNELAVLDELSAARQAGTDSEGAAPAVGLLGADPEADLNSARAAFSKGDLNRAASLANSARSAWQSANGAGQVRIFGSLAVLAGALLLLVTFLWTRGGRRGQTIRAGATVAGGSHPARHTFSPGKTARGRPEAIGVGLATMGGAAASAGATANADAGQPAAAEEMSHPARRARPRELFEAPLAATSASGRTSAMGGSDDALPNGHSGAGETGYRGRPCQPDDGPDRDSAAGDSAAGDSAAGDSAAGDSAAGDSAAGDGVAGSNESAYDLLQRGHALLRDHHNAQAAVVLERAARLERSKGSILEALGRAYFNSGQYSRAAETFEALLEVDPSAHYGHFALGLSFVRLGRTPEAKAQLRLAVALDPASDTYRRTLEKVDSRDS
jgi:tetratricopeptide (TPR) repeat protein